MRPLKVMTVVGTRPEIIKLSRIIAAIEDCCEHVLVHSGQNYDYELNDIFFRDLGIRKPDHFLDVKAANVAEAIGNTIIRADQVFEKECPDALLIYGDTNTCLCVIAAKRRKIPIFHMEAGNRCFDQRVPEETNRKIVDHVSDINMPLTEHARRYLLAEGLRPETVIKVGSTIKEVIGHYRSGIDKSSALIDLKLTPGNYILVSAHREENVDDPGKLKDLLDTLAALAEVYGKPIIVSTHPRTRQRLEDSDGGIPALNDTGIRFLKPFGYLDYVRLQKDAFCVLSDSGTLTEEAALLGFPAIMIRETHERPEGMDGGITVMTGLKAERVLPAIAVVRSQIESRGGEGPKVPSDYGDDFVSHKVVRIILSYVDYVNRTVWFK